MIHASSNKKDVIQIIEMINIDLPVSIRDAALVETLGGVSEANGT